MALDQTHNSQDIHPDSLLTASYRSEPPTNDQQPLEHSGRPHSFTEPAHLRLTIPSSAALVNDDDDQQHHQNHYSGHFEQVYTECTVPLKESASAGGGSNFFGLSSPLIKSSLEFMNLRSLKQVETVGGGAHFPMVDVNGNHVPLQRLEDSAYTDSLAHSDNHDDHQHHDDDDDDETCLARRLFPNDSKRNSAHAEVMKSLNNIRLNMSHQHLIEGSRNFMGKMRGLSMGDLNRPSISSTSNQVAADGRSALAAVGKKQHHYKAHFYILLTSLAILFLYLIYQNLFSDK